MKKINFSNNNKTGRFVSSTNPKYTLLALFVGGYTDLDHDITTPIENLKAVQKGEKKFEEIQDPNAYWSYAYGSGTFECDKETAWFDPNEEMTDAPSLEMPLSEVIYWLTEWKAFLEFGK